MKNNNLPHYEWLLQHTYPRIKIAKITCDITMPDGRRASRSRMFDYHYPGAEPLKVFEVLIELCLEELNTSSNENDQGLTYDLDGPKDLLQREL